jgi:hypothetical protein
MACLSVVSLATQDQRHPEREQYAWSRLKTQRQSGEDDSRRWWQLDKLWPGVLMARRLGMCWFFR